MVAAAESLTPLTFELGGKSANIVFPDADLDLACSVAGLLGAVLLSGQGCALPTRLYVHDDVYDEVVDRVVAAVESVTPIGDPLDPATLMGPVVSERRVRPRARCHRTGPSDEAGHARSPAARASTAPRRRLLHRADGVRRRRRHSDLAVNEVFGPVLSIMRFRDEDEVVARANRSDYGLAAYVYTRATARAHRVARRLDVGAVTVNVYPFLSPTAPFGGDKQSGFGREGGRAGIEEFLRRKNIVFS